MERSQSWNASRDGLFFAVLAYNTFVISTLSFIGQLERVTPQVLEAEASALRHMVPGPGNWCIASDLHRLKEHYGQSASFRSVWHNAFASGLRVSVLESIQFENLHNDLQHLRRHGEHFHRFVHWREWYDAAYASNIVYMLRQASDIGIFPGQLYRKLRHTHSEAGSVLQKTLYEALLKRNGSSFYDPEARVRHKMKRWKIQIRPGILARRVLRRLSDLHSLVPPRVAASVFRTLWNGWCTSARFQAEGKCVLACSTEAADRIEHYCRCPFFSQFATQRLGLQQHRVDLPGFLLVDHNMPESELTLMAIAVYAMNRLINAIRKDAPKPGTLVADLILDALTQFAKTAVSGHFSSTKHLHHARHGRFVRNP